MKNKDELISLIDRALDDTNVVVAESGWMTLHGEPIKRTRTLLAALRNEVIQNPDNINRRILRGMHNLGVSAFRDFENTDLEKSIGAVCDFLYKEIFIYQGLQPLGRDFGTGFPFEGKKKNWFRRLFSSKKD